MPRRRLDAKGSLPDFSWLYKHPRAFTKKPSQYEQRCSWCNEPFWILKSVFRVCPKCDMSEGK